MKNEILCNIIMEEVNNVRSKINSLVNVNKKYKVDILVSYEFSIVNGKMQDFFKFEVIYDYEVDLETVFVFKINSLSIIYIETISSIIRDLTDLKLDKSDYIDKFNELYNSNSGLYYLDLLSVS